MNRVTKINLSNLKKCNQVWADMPKNEKGKLCLKCNNTIIDFRKMTDSEIAETHLFSEQKVCGLYKKKQLQAPKRETSFFKLNSWNSFYFGLFSFLSFNSYSQENVEPIKTVQTENKNNFFNKKILRVKKEKHSVVKDSIFISGTLTDKSNEPLVGGNVIIKGTKVGTSSNFDGFYRLNITKELDSLKKLTLVYSFIGYETVEKLIDVELVKTENNRNINIEFKEGHVIEFVVYERAPFHKRVWNTIKNIFRKKKR